MKAENISLAFNLDIIYDNANFNINDLDKVGVVGVNGAGKTTLFKVALKELELDSGKIKIDNKKRIGYLPQEIILEDNEMTVFDYIMSARPIDKLNKNLIKLYEDVARCDIDEQPKILKQISKTQEMLEYYDCYNAENEMLEIITNMGIDSSLLDRNLRDLSGGQKSKMAFAHLLYSNPEIMLLDEPTNHLDIETKQYITEYLKNYKGMVLIISHDVDFLNAIVNKILYINKTTKKINLYDGNYDVYKKKLEKEKEIQNKLIDNQEREIRELREFVEKAKRASRTNHNLKKMGKDREIKLQKKLSELNVREKHYKKLRLNIKPNREGSKIPLKINNISFGYDDKLLINNLSIVISNRERFLIVGENGVGKSTLLKLIVDILKPLEGNIWFGSKTDIAYYAQELELLDLNKNILENMDSNYSEKDLRTILGSFLFTGDDVFKKVSVLSPGEKARVALAKIMLKKANLLILDEPTNHLDPETQKIIGENFKNYEGTIIVVSHNPTFVEQININRMLILPSGKITNYSRELLEHYYKLNTKN